MNGMRENKKKGKKTHERKTGPDLVCEPLLSV